MPKSAHASSSAGSSVTTGSGASPSTPSTACGLSECCEYPGAPTAAGAPPVTVGSTEHACSPHRLPGRHCPRPRGAGRGGGPASPRALVDLQHIAKRSAFPRFVPSEITRTSLVRLSPCSCVLHPRRAPCAACGHCVESTALLVPLALEGQCEHCEALRGNQMCVSEVTG